MTWTSEAARMEAEQLLELEAQIHDNYETACGDEVPLLTWASKCWDSIDKLKKKYWDNKDRGIRE